MDDPYAPIADLYDLAYGDFTDDVDFYANLARSVEGPLLELGVGSGRVAVPLAKAGFEVWGIDTSEAMLERARGRLGALGRGRGRLELVRADMRAFDLGRKFAMVFVAADTFQHLLTTADQRACLESVTRHLAPGGVFAMSVRSPASVSWDDAGAPAPLLLDWSRLDPDTGETVMKFVADQPDAARMVRRLTYVYDRVARDGYLRRSVFVTELRHSTEAELRLLLQQVGLRVTHVYGDYDLSPVGAGENLVFVARLED
ncbi:MAG TPA: methyltransferase domain-containing protein [Dehalococcoidia bacterium]|nr:methyltransferase domain-containing protein [Dehalococcoidia bacterium]